VLVKKTGRAARCHDEAAEADLVIGDILELERVLGEA